MGQWEWPDELDALLAAPDHHHLLLENERVRVLETVIPAGETTAVHTHRWANVQYVVSGADFVRRDGDGKVTLDTRAGSGPPKPSTVLWSGPNDLGVRTDPEANDDLPSRTVTPRRGQG